MSEHIDNKINQVSRFINYYPVEDRWCPRSDIEILEEITGYQDSTVSFLDGERLAV